jgi:hypothetical protein
MTLSATVSSRRRWSCLVSPLVTLLGAALLFVATPAAAHPGCCVQCVNPHGDVIPPAGSADPCDLGRLPTTNASNAGFNPDGFFQVGTRDDAGTCTAGDLDVTLFSCTNVTFDQGLGQFVCGDTQQIGTSTFPNGTLIKYTEANGAQTPTVKPMGSNNGSGNPNGGAVAFHIKAAGDLLVCSDVGCELCFVPPPPK